MSEESTQVKPPVSIIIDKDRLRAWIEPEKEALLSEMTAQAVQAELEKAKVARDDAVARRIEQFLAKIQEEGQVPERFLIAEGEAPVPPQDGCFELAEELAARQSAEEAEEGQGEDGGQDRVDYRTWNFIVTVESETVIGKLIPPDAGSTGVDVHGNELRPKGSGRAVQLQDNVRLAEDGEMVWSTAAGRVVYEKGQLHVDDMLEIRGDVNYESGNIDATSDVHIRGTVRDLFEVMSKKSIMVEGAIEAAEVRAAENLLVRGGILGRSKGKVVAGKELAAKFCDEADLRAEGDVRVDKELINSKVSTEGRLYVEHGTIIGGEIYAKRGVVVRNLGSESGVATNLRVGVPLSVLWKGRQIEEANKKRAEAVEHIRQLVQLLMTNAKRLSAAQKERATELLFQAESMETEIEEARTELERMLGEGYPAEEMFVRVQGQLGQGVSIAIGDRATVIKMEMKGPVQIELRKIDDVTEFAAVDQVSGSVAKLPCERVKIEKPEEAGTRE